MNVNKSKSLISGLSFLALLVALLIRNDVLSSVMVLTCLLSALFILYRNLASLSNVSEDNPKLKTVRFVTVFNVVVVAGVVVFAFLIEKGVIYLSEAQGKYFFSAFLAVLVIVFGNIAPKLPFNRYTGLRLPWTVRDEQTWIVAHRILGYISLPIGVLCFAGATFQMDFDLWIKVWFLAPLFIWIGIPAAYSGLFYYRKYTGKL